MSSQEGRLLSCYDHGLCSQADLSLNPSAAFSRLTLGWDVAPGALGPSSGAGESWREFRESVPVVWACTWLWCTQVLPLRLTGWALRCLWLGLGCSRRV